MELVETVASDRTTISVLPAAGGGPAGEQVAALRPAVEERLAETGAVLLRGLPVATADDFHQVVNRFGEAFTAYHGNSPRTNVTGGVWTSTEYPPEYEISLHNELSQSSLWPSRLFFCCLVAPETGGATPVSDGRALLADLDDGVRDRFQTRGVAYLQSLHGGFGLGRSWQQTYGSSDRDEVEQALRSSDVSWTWTADGDLRLRQVRPAVRTHPVTGETVWFNQAEQFHVSSLPPADSQALLAMVDAPEELPQTATYGDGSPIPDADLAEVRAVQKRNEAAFTWQVGDVLAIDNLLVLHGRHAFTGPRRILVAMT